MISHKLLSILCCPETKQALKIGEALVLEQVIKLQEAGELKTITGSKVMGPVTGILVRDDEKIFYAVREDIPVLLVEEGVLMSELAL